MNKNFKQAEKPKLMTAQEVKEEFLPMDIRKVREFLNANCKVRKIGNRYFYIRKEVEEKLIQAEGNADYSSKPESMRR